MLFSRSDRSWQMWCSLQTARFLDAIEHAIREVQVELADQDHWSLSGQFLGAWQLPWRIENETVCEGMTLTIVTKHVFWSIILRFSRLFVWYGWHDLDLLHNVEISCSRRSAMHLAWWLQQASFTESVDYKKHTFDSTILCTMWAQSNTSHKGAEADKSEESGMNQCSNIQLLLLISY